MKTTLLNRFAVRRANADDGSALILAMVLVTVLGLFLVSVLSFSSTGLQTTTHIRAERKVVYSADGAVQTAIQKLSADPTKGLDGDTTCGLSSPLTINGESVIVDCAAETGSGLITGPVGVSPANVPKNAILTTNTGTALGFNKDKNKGTPAGFSGFPVSGQIFSNSTITTESSGDIDVRNGAVYSRGTCQNISVQATFLPLHCNYGSTMNSDGDDPHYQAIVSTPPAVQAAPSTSSATTLCNSNNGMLTLYPGTYANATALNNAMNVAACKGIWFSPVNASNPNSKGAYYFNFSTGTTLTIPDKPTVGGEKFGWNGSASPPNFTTQEDGRTGEDVSCKTDFFGEGPGVQFIFGGNSRMTVDGHGLELCSKRSANEQNIAIYGVPIASSHPASGKEATCPPSPGGSFSPAGNACHIDTNQSSLASSTATSPSATLGSWNLASLNATTINSATLKVAHFETPTNRINSVSVIVNGNSHALTVSGSYNSSDSVDITADLQAALAAGTLNSVAIQYKVSGKNQAHTSYLDGMSLDLMYSKSGELQPLNLGGASFIDHSTDKSGLIIHGTVYAPDGDVKISSKGNNNNSIALDRGIIAKSLDMVVGPSGASHGKTVYGVQIPLTTAGASRNPRTVVFTAKIGSDIKLRVKVEYDDSVAPAKPKVKYWQVVR